LPLGFFRLPDSLLLGFGLPLPLGLGFFRLPDSLLLGFGLPLPLGLGGFRLQDSLLLGPPLGLGGFRLPGDFSVPFLFRPCLSATRHHRPQTVLRRRLEQFDRQ
jgi:hypothetical protein